MTSLGSRPHVLYAAWGFPPMAGDGVFRALTTANTLVAVGFDVTVLTAQRNAYTGFTEVDARLEARLDPALDVVRIPFHRPEAEFDIRRWPAERVHAPKAWLRQHRRAMARGFPDPIFGAWLDPLISAAERIHSRRRVDLTLGVAKPQVVRAVGHHLWLSHGVPHVIDDRFPWRLDRHSGGELHGDDPRVAALDSAYAESAREIWVSNEVIGSWHRRFHPPAANKVRVVPDGYDPVLAPRSVAGRQAPNQPLLFTPRGPIGRSAPVEEFILGWLEGRRLSPDLAAAHATLGGPLRRVKGRSELLAGAGEHGIGTTGPATSDAAGPYDAADVLVLLGSGPFVITQEVYDYAATGLPIVSIPGPDSAATDLLRDYPRLFPAPDLTAPSIAQVLIAAAESARNPDPELRAAAVAFAQRFETGRQFRDRLVALHASLGSQVGS